MPKRFKFNKKVLNILIPLLVAAVTVSSLAIAGRVSKNYNENTPSFNNGQTTEPVTDNGEQEDASVTLLAAGDNLIHMQIIASGENEDGTLDYNYMYENIKPYIEAADVAVINQETRLGGSSFEYSGYPVFNSPWEVGEAAINAGFDVFTLATDHSMDVGEAGIEKELEFFSKYPDVTHIGTNLTEEDYNSVTYVTVNGIKLAMLNYTFGTNGISIPEDKPYLINILSEDKVKKDVEEAKQNADAVIVFPHWGTENSADISEQQQTYTKLFAKLGVDVVIGTHPHILQKVEWVTDESTGHKTLVYYSLGNFISRHLNLNQMCGGLAEITIEKSAGTVEIKSAKLTPVIDYYTKDGENYKFSVYKLSDYTDDIAATQAQDGATVEYFTELVKQTVSEEFLDFS